MESSIISIKIDGEFKKITGKNIILATGARARELPGMEADGKLVWTYNHALAAKNAEKSFGDGIGRHWSRVCQFL